MADTRASSAIGRRDRLCHWAPHGLTRTRRPDQSVRPDPGDRPEPMPEGDTPRPAETRPRSGYFPEPRPAGQAGWRRDDNPTGATRLVPP
eukprot:4411074-Alexandrium_andersonii.AAC.1